MAKKTLFDFLHADGYYNGSKKDNRKGWKKTLLAIAHREDVAPTLKRATEAYNRYLASLPKAAVAPKKKTAAAPSLDVKKALPGWKEQWAKLKKPKVVDPTPASLMPKSDTAPTPPINVLVPRRKIQSKPTTEDNGLEKQQGKKLDSEEQAKTPAVNILVPRSKKVPQLPTPIPQSVLKEKDETETLEKANRQYSQTYHNVLQSIQPIIKSPTSSSTGSISNLTSIGAPAQFAPPEPIFLSSVHKTQKKADTDDGKPEEGWSERMEAKAEALKASQPQREAKQFDAFVEKYAALAAKDKSALYVDDIGEKKKNRSSKSAPLAAPVHKIGEVHGDHWKHLGNWQSYLKRYLTLIEHHGEPTENLYRYLQRQFEAGKYYSKATRKFRKK